MAEEFTPIDSALLKRLNSQCRSDAYPHSELRAPGSRCALTRLFPRHSHRIRHFPVRPTDVWIVTYPKSGTTWTQELVWLLCNDLNFKMAKEVMLYERVPFFEVATVMTFPEDLEEERWKINTDQEHSKIRIFKTHLPKDLLPKEIWTKKPKVIYVARDPKDVVLSYYHHARLWNGYVGTLDDYVEGFVNDLLVFSPYWDHVLDFWKIRNEPNIIFNSFEEMKKDLSGVIQRTADFLGTDVDEEQLAQLTDHLSFSSMKSNVAVNYEPLAHLERQRNQADDDLTFFRRGEAGAWKSELSPKQVQALDEWVTRNLAETDYTIGASKHQIIANGH